MIPSGGVAFGRLAAQCGDSQIEGVRSEAPDQLRRAGDGCVRSASVSSPRRNRRWAEDGLQVAGASRSGSGRAWRPTTARRCGRHWRRWRLGAGAAIASSLLGRALALSVSMRARATSLPMCSVAGASASRKSAACQVSSCTASITQSRPRLGRQHVQPVAGRGHARRCRRPRSAGTHSGNAGQRRSSMPVRPRR